MKIKLPPEPKFDLDKLLDVAVPPEAGAPAAVPSATGDPGAEASETGDHEKLLAEAPVTEAPVTEAPAKLNAEAPAKLNAEAPAKLNAEAPAKPGGRFDRYHSQFPELVKCYFRTGATAMLKAKAQELGFGSMSKLIRSALKYALKHGDFKEGWDK